MPMRVGVTAAVGIYSNPFVGAVKDVLAIDVNIANLTDKEVDAHGWIKAGIPLNRGGGLLAALSLSTVAAAVPGGGNVGNATIDSVSGGYGAPAETITVLALTTGGNGVGTARITGSKSGVIGVATVGTVFASPIVTLRIVDGTTDLTIGDTYTLAVTPQGGDPNLYGVTIEPIKLTEGNGVLRTGTFTVAITTDALLNRYLVEEILDRALTATEVAGFKSGGALKITDPVI